MFDRLPLWLQHLLIAFAAAAGADAVQDVVRAGGVTRVAWPAAGRAALDSGSLAVAVAAAALWALPITRQYGVGASKS